MLQVQQNFSNIKASVCRCGMGDDSSARMDKMKNKAERFCLKNDGS